MGDDFLNLLDRLNNRALGARSHDGLSLAEAQTQHQTASHLVYLVNQTVVCRLLSCSSCSQESRIFYIINIAWNWHTLSHCHFCGEDAHAIVAFVVNFQAIGSSVEEAIVEVDTSVEAYSVAKRPAHTNFGRTHNVKALQVDVATLNQVFFVVIG